MAPGRLRSTNARVLGRVKVWLASSFNVRYASVSTITPEHLPQINSMPTNFRAQTSGSRSKKEHGRKAAFGTPLRFVINRQGHAAIDRFPVAKGRDKSRDPEVFRGGATKSHQRRVLGNDLKVFQVAGGIHFHAQLHDAAQLRGQTVVGIMQPFELRTDSNERLRPDEITLFAQLLLLLVRENPEARFSVYDLESDGAKKENI